MKFIYQPEGAEPREWEFKPERLMNPEAEAIERLTNMTFGEWVEAVPKMSMLALHGLLYVLLKREMPTLKWDEVVFCADDLRLDLDDDEKADMRRQLLAKESSGQITEDEREALAELSADLGEEVDDALEAETPKASVALVSDAGPSTSPLSLTS